MRHFPMTPLAGALCLVLGIPESGVAQREPQAVYLNLVDSAPGSLEEITGALRAGFSSAGWEVLTTYQTGMTPNSCDYGARVLVVHSPRYARSVLAHGPRTAFAVPIRLVVYQDEAGTHVAAVNPLSINRTIIAETGFESESRAVLQEVDGIVTRSVAGSAVQRPYGQVRNRGLIGRTMGVMAGGPFPGKIETVHAVDDTMPQALERTADQVWHALRDLGGRGRWEARGAYRLDLAEQGVVVMGVSGGAMEAQAFRIVRNGNDDSRRGYRCPGVAHAAAFPIEVVVMRDSGRVRVTLVDAMYRMKMYFEDAGQWAFAKNMGMPGSIEDEIRGLILAGVGAPR